MATSPATKTPAAKTPRVRKEPVALTKRITQQLDRAVLARKITKEELQGLGSHITKLDAFLDA